jgi:hypothetical protein
MKSQGIYRSSGVKIVQVDVSKQGSTGSQLSNRKRVSSLEKGRTSDLAEKNGRASARASPDNNNENIQSLSNRRQSPGTALSYQSKEEALNIIKERPRIFEDEGDKAS